MELTIGDPVQVWDDDGGRWRFGEVTALDNGQTHDAFLNGGGFGCSHFWFGEAFEVGHAS